MEMNVEQMIDIFINGTSRKGIILDRHCQLRVQPHRWTSPQSIGGNGEAVRATQASGCTMHGSKEN